MLCLPAKKTITTKAGTKSYPMVNPDMHLLCYPVTKNRSAATCMPRTSSAAPR